MIHLFSLRISSEIDVYFIQALWSCWWLEYYFNTIFKWLFLLLIDTINGITLWFFIKTPRFINTELNRVYFSNYIFDMQNTNIDFTVYEWQQLKISTRETGKGFHLKVDTKFQIYYLYSSGMHHKLFTVIIHKEYSYAYGNLV